MNSDTGNGSYVRPAMQKGTELPEKSWTYR